MYTRAQKHTDIYVTCRHTPTDSFRMLCGNQFTEVKCRRCKYFKIFSKTSRICCTYCEITNALL